MDINAIICSITGHCSLCHKKSNISILNNGVCMADTLDLAEKCDDKDVDNLKAVEQDGVECLIGDDFMDYEKNYGDEGSENEKDNQGR